MEGGETPPIGLVSPQAQAESIIADSGSADPVDFEIRLDWPDYVVTDLESNRSWKVRVVEAHLLSVINGRRSFQELVSETRHRVRIRVRGEPEITDRYVNDAFLRLSHGDLLTDRDGFIAVSPKYAPVVVGSLSGAIAALLARDDNPPPVAV